MRRLLLILFSVVVGACTVPSDPSTGSRASDGLGLASTDARFDECVVELMSGPEAQVKANVQWQFRLSPDDAHDLVRDAILTVCVQHAAHGYQNLGGALQYAANNRAKDDWRHKRRYPQCPVDESVPSCNSTDDGVRFAQEERAVKAAMCRLDRVSERIVNQRIIDDVPFGELALQTGLTEDVARAKYHNAVRQMRRDLEAACPAPVRKIVR